MARGDGLTMHADSCGGMDCSLSPVHVADLSTAEDLTDEQIRHTKGDATTKLPEELRTPDNWNKVKRHKTAR